MTIVQQRLLWGALGLFFVMMITMLLLPALVTGRASSVVERLLSSKNDEDLLQLMSNEEVREKYRLHVEKFGPVEETFMFGCDAKALDMVNSKCLIYVARTKGESFEIFYLTESQIRDFEIDKSPSFGL